MPRFLSEESRQRWMQARWGGKAKPKEHQQAVTVAREDALPVTLESVEHTQPLAAVRGLDDKIAQLQADLAVLEQARDILTR